MTNGDGQDVLVQVEKGISAEELGQLLEDKGLVRAVSYTHLDVYKRQLIYQTKLIPMRHRFFRMRTAVLFSWQSILLQSRI